MYLSSAEGKSVDRKAHQIFGKNIWCWFGSKNQNLHDKITERRIGMSKENWPFPPPSGPTPWTRKQIKQYAKQQREQAGEAPL